MSMFFEPKKGLKIEKDEFIKIYCAGYYFYTNYKVEEIIEKILEEGIKNINDLKKVLAWKSGCILMKESCRNNSEDIKYKKGFCDSSDSKINLYGHQIDLNNLFETYKKFNDTDFYTEVNKYIGIGPVYAICLLYFKNSKKYPIYDRFADVALQKIQMETDDKRAELWSNVKYRFPTDIEQAWNYYTRYIKSLDENFPSWKDNRDIDRALWMYGHMFNFN